MRTLLVVTLVALTFGCAEKLPDKLTLEPSGPLKFEKKGRTEDIKAAAWVGAQPYVKAVPASWESSDTSVVTVDDKGRIKAEGSGKAQVSATAWGLTASLDVTNSIVGSIEVKDDVPKPLKLRVKSWPLKVTVKDDKGVVIPNPVVRYRATDYCVEVSDEGVLTPLADGDCDVIAEIADKSAKIKLQVRE